MRRLVNNYDGELWFDNPLKNPPLVIVNRRRKRQPRSKGRKTVMKTNRRRRSRRGFALNRRRRRARRNFYNAGILANRPRRRRARRNAYFMQNRRRRRARSNPPRSIQLFGLALPPLDAVLFSGAGLIVPPMVSSWVLSQIPPEWKINADGTPNQITNFAVKGASVLLPSMLVRQFVNRRAGNIMLIAGSAWFVLELVRTFAPGVIPGLGFQPMLGAYIPRRRPALGAAREMQNLQMPRMTASVPSRLNPAERF